MDIADKFNKGKESHTYQRIDCSFRVDVFLGYNDEGNMSMVIVDDGPAVKVNSSKMITVKMGSREDGRKALSFDLIDNMYSSLFIIFCKDIILNCEKAGNTFAISTALLRWKYWKEMFDRKKTEMLDKNEVKGLLGELIILKDFFIANYGVQKALISWMGPLLGHKDFEIDDTWYEVKSVNENAIQVTINSLEQLDSDVEGHLAVVRLEDSNFASSLSININTLVSEIYEIIEDPDDYNLFENKLGNVGYEYKTEYDNICFVYKGLQMYKVDKQFPRLVRNNVDPSISNVKYSLLLEGLKEYLEG